MAHNRRKWGPLDGSEEWTAKKARRHFLFCARRGLKASWDVYLRLKQSHNRVLKRQSGPDRIWGPPYGGDEVWTSRASGLHLRFCKRRGIILSWAEYKVALAEAKAHRVNHGKSQRVWGPLDGSEEWTFAKAKAHRRYSERHRRKLTWGEYLRMRAEKRAAAEDKKMNASGPTFRRPAADIVAKILAKVS